jgi:hypothetical protein
VTRAVRSRRVVGEAVKQGARRVRDLRSIAMAADPEGLAALGAADDHTEVTQTPEVHGGHGLLGAFASGSAAVAGFPAAPGNRQGALAAAERRRGRRRTASEPITATATSRAPASVTATIVAVLQR